LGQYISALSNSAFLMDKPYGYLLFGIDDQSLAAVGTNFNFSKEKIGNQELESWIAINLEPRIDFRVFEFNYKTKPLVIIRIDPTKIRPVSFKGIEYIRVGSYKKKLDEYPEKERKIWDKASRTSFENRFAKDDLNDDDVLKLLDYPRYFELLGLPLPSNKEAILQKLKEERLVGPSDQKGSELYITNLGAILLAKNLKDFERLNRKAVRVIIYKGKDRLETIKEQEGNKGYATGFEGLIEYINDQLPSNEEIGKALRQIVKVYPEIAIRELVANMLIHQDFDLTGVGPMVEIFEDRIEFSNPGKPLIDPLRFIDHSPRSRNEKLAYFLRRIKVCEERGSGIDKVVNSAEVFQLPAPRFVTEEQFFKVILYAPKTLRQMNKEDKVRACYQHCCLKYVSNGVMTNETLRGRFQISEANYSMASRIIAETIHANFIKASDPGNRSKKNASYIPFWA